MIDRAALIETLDRLPEAAPAGRPGGIARRLARWCLTPMGSALASILLLTGIAAALRDTGGGAIRPFTFASESSQWRRAMPLLERAARLRDASGIFSRNGDPDRAARYARLAAEWFETFIAAYPEGEPAAPRSFAAPRARLARAQLLDASASRKTCEDILQNNAGDPVAVLAALRWAATAEDPRAPLVRRRLEAALKTLAAQGDAVSRAASRMAGGAAADEKRRIIEELTGTRFSAREARDEIHYRLAEWLAAAGDAAGAAAHLDLVEGPGPWAEQAMKKRQAAPSPAAPDDLKVEKLGR